MAEDAVMTVWNVELGLAVHIKTPNNKYIVVDLGSKQDFSPLKKLKGCLVGYMVITHPHLDHISDIKNIDYAKPIILNRCRNFTREELLKDVRNCDRDVFVQYCNFVDKYCWPVSDSDSPTHETAFEGLTAEVFQATNCDKSNKNNSSSIVVVRYNKIKIIICGDNETESFQILMNESKFKDAIFNADVLVAPHHGRESGYYDEFVKTVSPKLTIISDTTKSDTSVADKYSKASSGIIVTNRLTFQHEKRSCLTTRNDGNIQIRFGVSELEVSTHN